MRTALITGGASGIGLAVAKRLKATGYYVTVLDPKPVEGFAFLRGDVRDYHSTLVLADFDIVVLNAAVFGCGQAEMMAVNFYGNISLIDRVNDNGHLIVVGSGGQFVAELTDGIAPYLASKAALSAYCRGMKNELAKRGVTVTEIAVNDCFDTPMGHKAGGGDMAPVSIVADAAEDALQGDGGIILVDRNGARRVSVHFTPRSSELQTGTCGPQG